MRPTRVVASRFMRRVGSGSPGHLRRLTVVPLAVGAAALTLAACGGGGNKAAVKLTPAQLVSTTFSPSHAVNSGRLSVAATVTLKGLKQLGGKPISLDLSGPFTRTDAALAVTVTIASSTLNLGLDRLAGQSYVGIEGTFYKLPANGSVLGLKLPTPSAAAGATGPSGIFGALGVDPASWISSPRDEGTVSIGGVDTEHLSAQLNVANILGSVTKLASGATGASSSLGSTLTLLQSAINTAKIDVYTGTADHIVRRVHLAIDFSVPPLAAGAVGGLTGGSLDVDATLTDVNQPQTIAAPANAQPASGLLNGLFALESKLGKLGSLFSGIATGGSLGGLFSGSSSSG